MFGFSVKGWMVRKHGKTYPKPRDARNEEMSEATRTIVQGNATAPGEPEIEDDLGFLWDFWYPALRSTEIVGKRLATAMLLEVPLVLGRTPVFEDHVATLDISGFI